MTDICTRGPRAITFSPLGPQAKPQGMPWPVHGLPNGREGSSNGYKSMSHRETANLAWATPTASARCTVPVGYDCNRQHGLYGGVGLG